MTAEDEVRISAGAFPAIRRRLATDIHARSYHDIGVEVSAGERGPELRRTCRIGTPHCKKGDRNLGCLVWDGQGWSAAGRTYASWAELRTAAFAELGVETWRDREHKGCFHRRGKARYDLVFTVAAALADRDVRRSTWASTGTPDEVALLEPAGHEIAPTRPSRHIGFGCCGQVLAMLRTDGAAVTVGGSIALDALWWRGLSVAEIASTVEQSINHTHHDSPTGRVRGLQAEGE